MYAPGGEVTKEDSTVGSKDSASSRPHLPEPPWAPCGSVTAPRATPARQWREGRLGGEYALERRVASRGDAGARQSPGGQGTSPGGSPAAPLGPCRSRACPVDYPVRGGVRNPDDPGRGPRRARRLTEARVGCPLFLSRTSRRPDRGDPRRRRASRAARARRHAVCDGRTRNARSEAASDQ
jgi:hypothetical protein